MKQAGFSLLETLMALALLMVLLGLTLQAFTQTAQLASVQEAESEAQAHLRSALGLIIGDVARAGESMASGVCPRRELEPVLSGVDQMLDQRHRFTLRVCDVERRMVRQVGYELRPDRNNGKLMTLYRNDRPVGKRGSYQPAVAGVVGLELTLHCLNSRLCDSPYGRFTSQQLLSVQLKVAAQSSLRVRHAETALFFGLADDTPPTPAPVQGFRFAYGEAHAVLGDDHTGDASTF